MEKEIVASSNNMGKIKEMQEILKGYTIISMKELGVEIEVEEDEDTFEKNARKKASTISEQLGGKLCLADDSGIEIEFLDGFPGVFTKRWFDGTDKERNLEILERLNGIPKEQRKVKFVTAIAISNGKETISTVAEINGYITEFARGNNGFGFDEIFELENGKTLAELSLDEKNQISARRKAIELIKPKLELLQFTAY